jgi:hypothetical protein
VRRTGAHSFLLANYSSPLGDEEDPTWIEGQTDARGTQIHLFEIDFEAPPSGSGR